MEKYELVKPINIFSFKQHMNKLSSDSFEWAELGSIVF